MDDNDVIDESRLEWGVKLMELTSNKLIIKKKKKLKMKK